MTIETSGRLIMTKREAEEALRGSDYGGRGSHCLEPLTFLPLSALQAGITALRLAAQEGYLDIARLLLDEEAEVNQADKVLRSHAIRVRFSRSGFAL
jgi:hypothetical protein